MLGLWGIGRLRSDSVEETVSSGVDVLALCGSLNPG